MNRDCKTELIHTSYGDINFRPGIDWSQFPLITVNFNTLNLCYIQFIAVF